MTNLTSCIGWFCIQQANRTGIEAAINGACLDILLPGLRVSALSRLDGVNAGLIYQDGKPDHCFRGSDDTLIPLRKGSLAFERPVR